MVNKRALLVSAMSLLALLVSSVVYAQACNGTRLRYWNQYSAYTPQYYYGKFYYYSDPAERLAVSLTACRDYATRNGLTMSRARFLASEGYTGHGYRDAHLIGNGGGCEFTVFAYHPTFGERSATGGGGNETLTHQCPQEQLKQSGDACGLGNPIDPATGNKYQVETDYRSADGTLEFTRHYNSLLQTPNVSSPFVSALGSKWRSNYDRRIRQVNDALVYVHRPNGKTFTYLQAESTFVSDADVTDGITFT